jgi:hypothetical protein
MVETMLREGWAIGMPEVALMLIHPRVGKN